MKRHELTVNFITPLLMEDPALCSRPITYIETKINAKDGEKHQYTIQLIADDEICLDEKGQWDTSFDFGHTDHFTWGRCGSVPQKILNKSGDDLRIDWGYLYLAVEEGKSNLVNVSQIPSEEATNTISGRLQLMVTSPIADSY